MAHAVEQAAADAQVGQKGAAALRAWFEYFRDRPAEYDLGFYLYGGAKPAGVGRDLNRELNVRLKRVYAAAADALEADGLVKASEKHERAVAGASWMFGVRPMFRTGRLKILSSDVEQLVDECLATFYREQWAPAPPLPRWSAPSSLKRYSRLRRRSSVRDSWAP